MSDALLTSKGAPPAALLSALALGLAIIGSMWWLVHELQEHHTHAMEGNHPVPMPLLTLAFPLSAMTVLALEIPLFMYVTDHAAFQSLNVLRPDHYGKCVAPRARPPAARGRPPYVRSVRLPPWTHVSPPAGSCGASTPPGSKRTASSRPRSCSFARGRLAGPWSPKLAARGGPRARGRARRCARV